MLRCGSPWKPRRPVKTELVMFTSQVKIPERQVQKNCWSLHSLKRVLRSPGVSAPGQDYGPSTTHTRAGIVLNDKAQSCRTQWSDAEVQGGFRETKLRRRGILRHDRSGTLPYLETSGDQSHGRCWTREYHEVTPAVILPEFPCHTKAVERHVKLMTEVAKVVCGQKSRDGFIRARVSS